MIYKDVKEITAIHINNKMISAVYKGAKLVWQSVRSCFGSGFWVNQKGWINQESWKNK